MPSHLQLSVVEGKQMLKLIRCTSDQETRGFLSFNSPAPLQQLRTAVSHFIQESSLKLDVHKENRLRVIILATSFLMDYLEFNNVLEWYIMNYPR